MKRFLCGLCVLALLVCLSACGTDGSENPVTQLLYHQVRFDSNGGSGVSSVRAEVLTEAPQTARAGYLFGGWYHDRELLSPVQYPLEISADMVLYAKWYQLTAQTDCADLKLKFLDRDYDECVSVRLSPTGFDFDYLEKQGYGITVEVRYDVRYRKDYEVLWDIGYLGSPKYEVGIVDEYLYGQHQENLPTTKDAQTNTLSVSMSIEEFREGTWSLYFGTDNIQNIVCIENISVTYTCSK